MGWFKNIDKIKSSVKQQMKNKIATVKAEAEIARIEKEIEELEAKNNETLDTSPSVDTSNTNS